MRRENRKDDAVSPVIGVMLMLVVTIVIAAVVVMFSTGLAGDTKTTPTALFEVSGTDTFSAGASGEELAYVNIRHKGGDTIPLSDLQITLESVGGSNNGIINALTASDNIGYYDSESGNYVPPEWTQEDYNNNLESRLESPRDSVTQAQFMLEQALAGNPDYLMPEYGYTVERYQEQLADAKSNLEWEENNFKQQNEHKLSESFEGGSTYPIAVLGQTVPTKSTVSTGDIIHICPRSTSGSNTAIYAGTGVKWTISYIPTNSIIAKGEFEVIAD